MAKAASRRRAGRTVRRSGPIWGALRRLPLVMGVLVAIVGVANVLYALGVFSDASVGDAIRPLEDTVVGGFEALGRSAQLGLGGALAVVGLGLTRRLHSAWAFAVLLLVIMTGASSFVSNARDAAVLGLPGLGLLLALIATRRAFVRPGIGAGLLAPGAKVTPPDRTPVRPS